MNTTVRVNNQPVNQCFRFEDPPARIVNGTELPHDTLTPDWRLREPPWYAYRASYLFTERDRPFRISPHYKQTQKWKKIHRWFVESENLVNFYFILQLFAHGGVAW